MLASSIDNSIQIHDERFQQTIDFNPFLDDQDFIFGHILYPEIGLGSANNTNNDTTTAHKASSQDNPISRKRSSGAKDRHSKICTSKGPRDRRMRLSLEIARRFFDLQDMLGFDKASKTVEWLFTKSRSAIKELKEKFLLEANSSEPTLVRNVSLYRDHDQEVPRGKKRRKLRIVDKESRFKARARARARTRAKLIRGRFEISKSNFEGNPVGVCKMEDVIEESSTKSKSVANFPQNLGSKAKNSASLISNHCYDKRVSKESCSEEIHLLPGSSMDMGTLSLDTMRASPAGLKLSELDEVDGVLIFYGE